MKISGLWIWLPILEAALNRVPGQQNHSFNDNIPIAHHTLNVSHYALHCFHYRHAPKHIPSVRSLASDPAKRSIYYSHRSSARVWSYPWSIISRTAPLWTHQLHLPLCTRLCHCCCGYGPTSLPLSHLSCHPSLLDLTQSPILTHLPLILSFTAKTIIHAVPEAFPPSLWQFRKSRRITTKQELQMNQQQRIILAVCQVLSRLRDMGPWASSVFLGNKAAPFKCWLRTFHILTWPHAYGVDIFLLLDYVHCLPFFSLALWHFTDYFTVPFLFHCSFLLAAVLSLSFFLWQRVLCFFLLFYIASSLGINTALLYQDR